MPRPDTRSAWEWETVIESIQTQVEESDAVFAFRDKIKKSIKFKFLEDEVTIEINDFEAAVLVQAGIYP